MKKQNSCTKKHHQPKETIEVGCVVIFVFALISLVPNKQSKARADDKLPKSVKANKEMLPVESTELPTNLSARIGALLLGDPR